MKSPVFIAVASVAGVLILIFLIIFGLVTLGVVGHTIGRGGKDAVAVVEVDGAIDSSEPVVKQIHRFRDESAVKAVVVRVDSPGGEVAASQEIYQEFLQLRERGKPVVASMGSVAASGGYYVACAADKIVANPGSVTGSIGVLVAFPNVQGLMEKVGLDAVVIKSGKHKDLASPLRSITDEERQILQRLIDDVHDQFVEAVAFGRGISEERVRQLSDGSIFSGRQAMVLGLVDELGDLYYAIRLAAKMAGIEGEPRVIMGRKRGGFLRRLLEGRIGSQLLFPEGVRVPSLLYLWRPGLY